MAEYCNAKSGLAICALKQRGVMKVLLAAYFIVLFSAHSYSQDYMPQMLGAEAQFFSATAQKGMKSAFLEYLAPDSILFRPQAVNGLEYWNQRNDTGDQMLVRKMIFADIAANGLLGYTTGNWRLYQKGKNEAMAVFGQYVTIWEKKPDGSFRASLDIAINHDKLPFSETDYVGRINQKKDLNKRGWSPADASMQFLRMSMAAARLGAAYEKFAANDVRMLLEREPPIVGKKRVVSEMERYVAVEFPTKVALFQSADMAYTWNPCRFTNNEEGMESGNCLHIWKLRNKKWWIVLGVFAKFPNEKPPVLKGATR